MTTNKYNFISKVFVVGITYLILVLIEQFNIIDFIYLLFIIGSFIKYSIIKKENIEE